MRCRLLLFCAFLLVGFVSTVSGADILGNWIADASYELTLDTAKSPAEVIFTIRNTVETVFSFNVKATELTGTVTNAQGEAVIREGKISGNDISFAVIRDIGGTERTLLYSGLVSLNEIRFTLEIKNLDNHPVEFIAKREFPRHGDLPLLPLELKRTLE
jgi:hypothetical protein